MVHEGDLMKKILANNKLMLIGLIILVALICVVNGCKEDDTGTGTATDTELKGPWHTADNKNMIVFNPTGSLYVWSGDKSESGTYTLKGLEITFSPKSSGTPTTFTIDWKDDKKDEMTLTNKDKTTEKYTFKQGLGGSTSTS
jgi:hypothetical protein